MDYPDENKDTLFTQILFEMGKSWYNFSIVGIIHIFNSGHNTLYYKNFHNILLLTLGVGEMVYKKYPKKIKSSGVWNKLKYSE